MNHRIDTPTAPRPKGPYSQAIVAGDTIYVAGQGPLDVATGTIVTGDIEREARLTFANVKAILEAAGFRIEDAVKVTVYLADLANFEAMNAVYREAFREPYPARATVGSALLFGTGIEVDCIAVRQPRA